MPSLVVPTDVAEFTRAATQSLSEQHGRVDSRYCFVVDVLSDRTHNSGSSSTFSGALGSLIFTAARAPFANTVPRAIPRPGKWMIKGMGMTQVSLSGKPSCETSPLR